jgi:hypothetical protein
VLRHPASSGHSWEAVTVDKIAQLNLTVDGVTYTGAGDSIAEAARELERDVDAAEARDQAAHQAAKDADREPDRWPAGTRPVDRWRVTPKGEAYLERYRRLTLRERGEGRP